MGLCNFVSLWKIYLCLVIPNNLHWKSCDYLYLYSLPTYMGLGMVELVVNLADLLWHHHIEQVNRICACYSQDGRKPEHKSFTLGEDQTNATKDKVPWRDIVGLPSSGALIRGYLHCQKIRWQGGTGSFWQTLQASSLLFVLLKDNPADFNFFFYTSRRRSCYIATERFLDSRQADQMFSKGV